MKTDYECKKVPQKLYKIGMFAQINRITIKALRYYDSEDLLKPEKVDDINGYRYYTSAQLPRLHKILSLKGIGFSIDEIKAIFNGISEEDLLKKKRQEYYLQISKLTNKLAIIDMFLHSSYEIKKPSMIIKSLPEVIVAYKQVCIENYDALMDEMPAMGAQMEQAGCVCAEPEYCFNVYLEPKYKEANIEIEMCEAVTKQLPDQDSLKFKVLPKVEQAVCILHKGSYETLPETYQYLVNFIEENGYDMVAQPREFYIDGVWNKDSEEEWLTEIQFPIAKLKE